MATVVALPASALSARPSALLKSILLGGMLVAVLDLTEIIIFVWFSYGTQPYRIPQVIAASLLGKESFHLGASSVLLGLGLHLLVAFSVVTVYALLSRSFSSLGRHPVLSGVLYGWGVYAFMNYVVVPLTALPEELKQFHVSGLVNGLVGHALLVGLPTAWAVHRSAARALVSAPPDNGR